MAEHVAILRPISDIPENDNPIFLLVNEEVADDSSTEISLEGGVGFNGESEEVNYAFGIDTSQIPSKANVLNVRLMVRSRAIGNAGGNITGGLYVNDAKVASSTVLNYSSYAQYSELTGEYQSLFLAFTVDDIKVINTYIKEHKSFPPLYFYIHLYAGVANEYKDAPVIYLTQTYLEITYNDVVNIGVYEKAGGKQMPSTAAYKKVGGAWSEITEDECKEVLKNNTIRRG